ncbi:MAG TPA: response regulator, partial [Rhodocyclaceae bacterium]|nr:response regulator [Rhodocyclaceae bacterium]
MGLFDHLRSLISKPSPEAPASLAPEFAEESALATERRARQRVDAREGTKALIIDDSPTIVAAIRKMLRSSGYETLEALDA